VKYAIVLREATDKTVKERSDITGISIASFYRLYTEYRKYRKTANDENTK